MQHSKNKSSWFIVSIETYIFISIKGPTLAVSNLMIQNIYESY